MASGYWIRRINYGSKTNTKLVIPSSGLAVNLMAFYTFFLQHFYSKKSTFVARTFLGLMMQFDLFFAEAKKAVVEKLLRPKPAPLFALLLFA